MGQILLNPAQLREQGGSHIAALPSWIIQVFCTAEASVLL